MPSKTAPPASFGRRRRVVVFQPAKYPVNKKDKLLNDIRSHRYYSQLDWREKEKLIWASANQLRQVLERLNRMGEDPA